MIDERNEELASLYALDLLDAAECAAFESALAADPALRALVAELRESGAALAHTAPAAEPPAELRARVLASVGPTRDENKLIRPPFSVFRSLAPWAAAAGFAVVAAWLGQRYVSSRSEAALLREQVALTEIALKSAQNENEAAQIVARRQLATLNQQLADTARQLADTQQRATGTESRLAQTALQLAAAEKNAGDAATQIAQLNQRLATTERLAADTRARSTELDHLLASAQGRIASLQHDFQNLQAQGDLANFKIATLASMLKNSPQALAVAVWNPAKQEGVFTIEKLPAAAPGQDYELWVIAPNQPKPIAAGVFAVGADGMGRAQFTTESPVAAVAKFAVSREKKGGAPAHAGPQGDVIMISQ